MLTKSTTDVERRIRDAMREMDVRCPSCGSDCIAGKGEDTDVGIMDDTICSDCECQFFIVSSVHTYMVIKES